MAADLWGDLLGTEAHLTAAEARWLSPLSLWTGILAGPIAWTLNLGVSYALVKPLCLAHAEHALAVPTAAALAMVTGGAALAWIGLAHTRNDRPEDGGSPRQRARFMSLVGIGSSVFFAVAIAATAIPWWVLDACH